MRKSSAHIVAFLSVVLALAVGAAATRATRSRTEPVYDLVITNARVVDGAGNPWFRADVAVKGGRIARVGRVAASEGKKVIDARGQVLAPGFIDVHTHVENVYELPDAENFVRMGVTTLITGNCGGSALDVGKFLGRASETPIAVNLATLVGHNSVRRAVLGEANRQPSTEELEKMKALVERAMQDGAVGLSTGLFYVPGAYAKTDEVVELAKVAARYGGVYATHMRDEGDRVADSVRESIEIGERAGLPVEISHFKVSAKKLWGKSTLTLGLVRDARKRGLSVTVDQYAYTASSTSLDSRLPDWVEEGGREEGKKRIADPAQHARILREMKDTLKKSGFKDFSYAAVASYGAKHEYDGKNIAEIAKLARGKADVDSQVEQILEMYAAGGASMVYHSMGEDDVRRIMREPFTMIASDSGVRRFGEGVPHPRGYGNNARVLAEYVRGLGLIPLEDAVRKMTSLPAQTFSLRDRGLVREGMAADLVVFDDAAVSDPATFDKPHQYAVGFSLVIVNGEVVLDSGRMTGARPGAALRHASSGAAQSS
ncbi:MAG TPA: D-aminoacylase [Pyrinomonadaceae bacterium]|jgi:N-acyl-D-amino-acid deacylase|nr:D-aminoacylase [Pyrinomonadaceae bacterium]